MTADLDIISELVQTAGATGLEFLEEKGWTPDQPATILIKLYPVVKGKPKRRATR